MNEPETFDDAPDAAGDTLSAAVAKIDAQYGEKQTPNGADPAAPVEPGGTTPPASESAKPAGSDDSTGKDSGAPAVSEDGKNKGGEDWDVERTWNKYKSEDERKQALAESQRTLIERNAEAKRLREENELLRAGKTKDPEPPPTNDKPTDPPKTDEPADAAVAPRFDEWMENLSKATDPNALPPEERALVSRLSTLRSEKKELADLEGQHKTGAEKEAELEGGIRKLKDVIAEYEADLKEDSEDEGLRQRLRTRREQLAERENDLIRHRSTQDRLQTSIVRKERAFNDKVLAFEEEAGSLHADISDRARGKQRAKGLNDTWTKGVTDVLTARASVPDRVLGLQLGADDYLSKPFDLAELEARVQALLRRPGRMKAAALRLGALEMLPGTGEVLWQGQALSLTPREVAALQGLLASPQRPVSKEKLHAQVFAAETAELDAVEVLIHRLRKKLETLTGAQGVRVTTFRGMGYMLTLNDADHA